MPAISLAGVDSAGGGIIIISSSGVTKHVGSALPDCRHTAIMVAPHGNAPACPHCVPR